MGLSSFRGTLHFDFMTDEALKISLESDYAELLSSLNGQAWKAAHVLAGSIIEALLVDSLRSLPDSDQPSKDPLKMEFAELISVCRSKGVLSERTEQLSSVVRGYRNLIHPGRVIRLNEPIDGDTAKIAHALVEIILKEVGAKRKETYGYTAEQILDKIEHDASAVAILSDLMRDMQPREFTRILADLLPKRYFECSAQITDHDADEVEYGTSPESASRASPLLERAFRPIFDAAPENARIAATKNFVRIRREEGEANVLAYEAAFFRCSDLRYLPSEDVEMVKRHVLSRLQDGRRTDISILFRLIEGIGLYLTQPEALEFANTICNVVDHTMSWDSSLVLPFNAGIIVAAEYNASSEVAKAEFDRCYNRWVESAKSQGRTETAEKLKELQSWWTPF